MCSIQETQAALEAGELAEDQVAVICRHAPTHIDRQIADLGRQATVTQLRRVLADYKFGAPPDEQVEERRRVSFRHGDDG